MLVPLGRRYFLGVKKSSVKNQPSRFTVFVLGLKNSTESTCGRSVCVSTSLMMTGLNAVGAGSITPGEPFTLPLARQLALLPQVFHGAFSSTITSEKPRPSVIGYQRSL